MAKSKKKTNSVSIDWTEEEGGKFIKNPGEYVVQVTSTEVDEDDEGKQFIEWKLKVTQGKAIGSTISFRTFITPKALWKLRDVLTCLGISIEEQSVQDLDLDEIVEDAKEFVIEVEEGNERADGNGYYMRVADCMPLDQYNEIEQEKEEAEEDEAPKKKSKKAPEPEVDEEEEEEKPSKKKSKKKAEPEEDEEEALDEMEDEIDELGLDIDLDDYDTFEEKKAAFEKAKKKASKGKKSSKDEEEESEDEEQTYSADEINELGTKELRVIAEEIGLELDDDTSTKSKRRSVIAALKKVGRLEE